MQTPATSSRFNASFPVATRLLIPLVRLLTALSPALASRLAERLFFTPLRHRPPSREGDILRTAQREWLEFRGKRVAAWRWGSGPTVLLAHGWSGRGGQLAAFVEPLVATGFSVLTWDAPGHGQSDGERTNLLELVALIDLFARREGRVHAVVGHSLGGDAAVLARALGTPVERVVLIGAAADPSDFFRRFLGLLGFDVSGRADAMSRLETKFDFRWSEANVSKAARALGAVPSLILHDREDAEVPFQDAEAIAGAWPGARLHETHGLGHRRILRDPGVVASVARFLADGTGREFHSEMENLESELWDRSARWHQPVATA
jgi:pimeloyl-ACP methyl ester carboxylesterase